MCEFFHFSRIQSQHNLLEKELAEHTIDFLKSSNIRIVEKVNNFTVSKKKNQKNMFFMRFCFDFSTPLL
jgi:hypothetical protein